MNHSKTLRGRKLDEDSLTASQDVTAHQSNNSSRHQTITTAALELSGTETAAVLSAPLNPVVVQIIDTTKWSDPSPDPSGVTFVPAGGGGGNLLVCDSEVNESPFLALNNLFHLSATGVFDHSSSLQSFTIEPTGLVYASQSGHIFISDDDKSRIFEVDAGNPGVQLGSFSTSSYAPDCEDITYDPLTNHLFIVNGTTGNLNGRTIFETTTGGSIVGSMLLPSIISDPEAIAYDFTNQIFYVAGGFSDDIWVVSRDGKTILDTITVLEDYQNPVSDTRVHPKGLALAPSSNPNDDASVMSLWVADYGRDQMMDGRLFEIGLSPGSSLPPLFTANNDAVNFNQVDAGTYQAGTQYDALGGNDTVILPTDAAAAAAAGYDPARTFNGGDGTDTVTGGSLNDSISGSGGGDKLDGGAGNDSLSGGSSADTLIGGPGSDVLNGGSSNDTVDYSAAGAAATINLALGTATGEGNDTLISVERALGSGFADMITGSGVANVLTGNGGNDTIHGGSASDTLTGSSGTDQLFGEAGHDTLKWDLADSFDGGADFDTLDANLSSADTISLLGGGFNNLERIRTGSGKDTVTLSLNDVLSDTADDQFVADLGSGSSDTLNIDLAGGWSKSTPDSNLGPTGVAASISISGMTAHTFTNGTDIVTIFSNAEVVNSQILSS
jgi:Ca2+-binding RTX toxin-like protein